MNINDILLLLELIAAFLPFVLFTFLNAKTNMKKEVRYKQYPMLFVAVIYSIVLMFTMSRLSQLIREKVLEISDKLIEAGLDRVGDLIQNLYSTFGIFLEVVLFNTFAILAYIAVKRILTLFFYKLSVDRNSWVGTVVDIFYSYDESEKQWYIKEHYGQARTFIKTVYYAMCIVSAIALIISCMLCMNYSINVPFYPVFALIIVGEMAFYIDGLEEKPKEKNEISVQTDQSKHIALYPLLRGPLRNLFGDKLSAEGTTVNNDSLSGGAIEDILVDLEQNEGHIGKNYAMFIRRKMEEGLKPNPDYVRSGYDLSVGKSLLFNTPFYDKLNPYVFYAMNRELLTGGKVLIVLGRHGTEEDLQKWTETGMKSLSNVPDLWKIGVLTRKKVKEEELPDIGIISCSGVHDLDIHKSNLLFLRKVSFVMVVEPSRLVTTAQIGLNLLIKSCGSDHKMTFCSVDRNCDGLVDAMSHILMTNITEVSATEYPHGMSSFMYWTADEDYLQHRIMPGVSRYLGMGTELSAVALKNQVEKTVWYGGEAYPVLDARWIAKQYYYNLLDYAQLPANQEVFDKVFKTSFNMCDERVSDYSFISVEDDRNNLFETRRNFATIAEQQGFVNVISSEYMFREYMSQNPEVFSADAKAIPYLTADYARTKRNAILSLCLLMCVDPVQEEFLARQVALLNVRTKDPVSVIWQEICRIFSSTALADRNGTPILTMENRDGKTITLEKDSTILFKRVYSEDRGRFESVYTIEDADFSHVILDDLKNASYIAEQEHEDIYIGTELKGHVYQKYLPGQLFTLSGKYYEMVGTATDNRIMVRRASEHIGGRLAYRQIRKYTIHHLENSDSMGALKTVNDIDIHYQYADFSVETPGYWKLHSYNDFDNGDMVELNGVPTREYHHKQILKFDFSRYGDAFTDSVRMTLTNLLNETFVTLFADNQPFISAITSGTYDAPLTYSLELDEGMEESDKCIYFMEDSQLDIGLLIAVERNIDRIFQIISDYLLWNGEEIDKSIARAKAEAEAQSKGEEGSETEQEPEKFDPYADDPTKKHGFFAKLLARIKKLLGIDPNKKKEKKKKKEKAPEETPAESNETTEETMNEDTSAEEPANEETGAEESTDSTEEESEAEESEEGPDPADEEAAEDEAEEPEDEAELEEMTDEAESEEPADEAEPEESEDETEAEETADEVEPEEPADEAEPEEPADETAADDTADEDGEKLQKEGEVSGDE